MANSEYSGSIVLNKKLFGIFNPSFLAELSLKMYKQHVSVSSYGEMINSTADIHSEFYGI